MIRRLICVTFTLLTFMLTMGLTKSGAAMAKGAPDFAYPEKVEQAAMRDLDAAVRRNDGPATVNALVRMGLAKGSVSSDSLPDVLARIEGVGARSNDRAVRSLLDLLQARIYVSVYEHDSYRINNRTQVSGMAGDDYRLWGRQQFMNKVRDLVMAALSDKDVLMRVPLTAYSDVVKFERESLTFYPTLYDFAASQALDCMNAFDRTVSLNRALAFSPLDTSLYPKGDSSNCAGEILRVYFSLIDGRDNDAPVIMARRNQLGYILPRLFGTGHADVPLWARGGAAKSDDTDYLAYRNAYGICAGSPYAVELLLAAGAGSLSDADKTDLYGLLDSFVRNNPSYFNINEVKNLRNRLVRKDVNVSVPTQAAKGVPVRVLVTVRNVDKLKLNIYDVTKNMAGRRESYYRMSARRPAPVRSVDMSFDGTAPFSVSQEVEVTLPEYGCYIIVPSFEGERSSDRSYPIVWCSDLSAGVYSGIGGARAVAVDALSGAPRGGVEMFYRPWSRAQANKALPGKTGDDGFMVVEGMKPGTLEPHSGRDVYAPACNYYDMTESVMKKQLCGEVFTSLNLYHPGDEVAFSVVAYEADKSGTAIAAERGLRITLRDANYMEIDTMHVVTDKWGRAEGAFTLPADGLTGNFTITVGEGKHQAFSRSFMVSDYKLPTFTVNITDVARPAALGDSARIAGNAQTFAGFPVEEGQVKVQLRVRTGFWYWASETPVFYEAETVTDGKGDFVIAVPGEVIASSPAPEGYFIADISVTSPDGETRETRSGFNMGKPFNLFMEIPETYQADGGMSARIEARDYNGAAKEIPLMFNIMSVDSPLYGGGESSFREVGRGVCQSGNVSGMLNGLASGEYSIRFAPADTTQADEVFARVTVYRSADRKCPVNTLLWVPQTSVTAGDDGVAEIVYGSAVESPHILMVTSDKTGRIAETRWLTPSAGLDTVRLKLPEPSDGATVYFRIVSNLESAATTVSVAPASSKRAITIETETFRDKVTPGDNETLKFRVKGVDGADVESAVILDMSNKAVDVLSPNPLGFVARGLWSRSISFDGLYFGSNTVYLQGIYKHLQSVAVTLPQWEFYGRDFFPVRVVMGRGMKLSASSARVRGINTLVMDDAADMKVEEEAAEEEISSAAQAPAYAAGAGMDNGAVLEEETVTALEQKAEKNDDAVFRPSELPLAFFRPMLQTDADGVLEVTYKVPDANTTWVLRSLAYNTSLLTAGNSVEIVASKPLMVSANATRFLRVGDKVRLQASVMNAADSAVMATTVCELVDYSTGKVLASGQAVDSIGGMGRQVVGIEFEVPADVQGVIYRVKSSCGTFTDGEQVLIPVLPSSQDVVESDMFYLAPGQNHFTLQVEAVKDGRAYLKFTENPAWEVVSALPGLRESRISSSVEAAASVFSAAVADGLMKDYPEIARTLRKWRDNPSDSVLVSALEKNGELKSILLSATPWVSEALGQTERMQRLVLLLDGSNTRRAIERGVADLAKTVTSEGGWSWTSQYPEPSMWCTGQILDMLGDLNRLGWLPSDSRLGKMMDNAVAYLDRETVKAYNKYPKGDYTSYCYTRQKFPALKQSTAAAKVTNVTVQRIIAGWKDHSVVKKGVDAIVLNAKGYNATARQILESLRQYATVTPEKGMWWQQLENMWYGSMDKIGCTAIILDAFAQTDPSNEAIDKIRQWLILEKNNTDWGNAIITSQVVASILTSGKEWTINTAGTAIRVGDSLIEPSKTEYAIGSFTEQITPMLKENTALTIDRQGNYPSFGAVVIMRRAAMNEIKAVGCAELSVEKHMSVFNGSEWVSSDRFKVGDRVKVTLVVKADADMDYVVIQDQRAAALEPVEQLPSPIWSEGLCFYRENRNAQTNIFINRMPRGTYVLDYELFATQSGTFSSGVAQAQSQYNPSIAAHSAGMEVTVE